MGCVTQDQRALGEPLDIRRHFVQWVELDSVCLLYHFPQLVRPVAGSVGEYTFQVLLEACDLLLVVSLSPFPAVAAWERDLSRVEPIQMTSGRGTRHDAKQTLPGQSGVQSWGQLVVCL